MQGMKRHSGQDNSAAAAAPAANVATNKGLLATDATPQQFCSELSTLFRVRSSEVALFRLEGGMLKFLFPEELKTAGTIPLSSSSAIAAHTAISKKLELFNNFPRVKHASIFETVKLTQQSEQPDPLTIQKLISGPVLNAQGKVLGVLQVCRKGFDLLSAGPDFSLDDLQQLERATKALAKAPFMKTS
ncbi:MAG TPA: hypothetical protein VGU64_13800 [Terriglobales bacterium]|nr:hypothetical protein [Terriglobales bacterium]